MDSQLITSQKKQKSFFKSKVELLSPAKINLYLNIVGKYSSGYHRLETVVERVSLFDKLKITINPNPAINISSNNKELETKENLCYKAAELIKKEFNLSFGFNIYLEKNIPIGAGLGGGSSNAASLLLGIKSLADLNCSREKLYKIGEKLGSDVNFFLSNSKFAFLTGRGQKVEPLFSKIKLNHFIVWPKIFVSTKKVYKNSKRYLPAGRQELTRFFSSVNILKYSLKNADCSFLKKGVYNCLEKSAFGLYEKLAEVKAVLNKGNMAALMTGSGGAFYTIGARSYKEVKSNLPDDWIIYKVQTF
ncbi:MAG: 4-(cytidine 5'-diphospho)-2-C-methyl-D-erythritol kinase [Candidatus Omnitrophica bacterium]|nr:4-(cytidine 5'-diphospho)-2-C-methyl-D-erythritol kinase [Candidatus Omnitrophota bacterium]MCF7878786.1 4-(cytidine 5'-diphospho)-2-C-methyl-D-erythritol kinase [Candidatus Omnitrophota bacterium]MCF7893327.1 4-(cytidine 5'-diphospho)-2-C-methyl-D-erythritol kinase [Candidatus Omnitrophota bacterium]